MTSVPKVSISALSPTHSPRAQKKVELAGAAATLLPGLQQYRLLLDTEIQPFRELAPPRQGTVSSAKASAWLRRTGAEIGHPPVRR